jgi:hypothetical protein
MRNQSSTSHRNGWSRAEVVGATRRGIVERLADPYLTAHDQWVLRQFARFLSGYAPEPDPRAVYICENEHVHRGRGDRGLR